MICYNPVSKMMCRSNKEEVLVDSWVYKAPDFDIRDQGLCPVSRVLSGLSLRF